MRITGTVVKGGGEASINYERQMTAAAAHCPEVAGFGHDGTINVQLDAPINKGVADCWTPKFAWQPIALGGKPWDQTTAREEEFGFVRINFEYPLNGPLHDAWIIFPSGHTATYLNPFYVEVIAGELIGGKRMSYDSRCAIHLDHDPAKQRPYSFGEEVKPFLGTPSLW